MKSRERLKLTLQHKEPDKVPIDLGGFQTGIHVSAYKRVLRFLNIKDPEIKLYDKLQRLAIPCDAILKRFEIDTKTIHLPSTFVREKDLVETMEGKYSGWWDSFGIFWGKNTENPEKDVLYNDIINPFKDFTTSQQIRDFDWPKGNDPELFVGLRDYAKNLYINTDYALIGRSMGCLFQWTHYLFGFKEALIHMIRNPDMMKAAMEGMLQFWIEFATEYLNQVGEYIQTAQITSDLTDQKGPMLSPRLYRKLIRPYEEKLADHLHKLADIKINYHCCGAASYFIPDFIEVGYDALNPVQIGAASMNPCEIKNKYGDQITFWGGLCDSQKTLPFGTIKEITDEVRYNINCLKPNGGYVAANIHNIVFDVPAENIIAMFDAAIKFREY